MCHYTQQKIENKNINAEEISTVKMKINKKNSLHRFMESQWIYTAVIWKLYEKFSLITENEYVPVTIL